MTAPQADGRAEGGEGACLVVDEAVHGVSVPEAIFLLCAVPRRVTAQGGRGKAAGRRAGTAAGGGSGGASILLCVACCSAPRDTNQTGEAQLLSAPCQFLNITPTRARTHACLHY